jgi:prepilin-type N-terminal cleavage/methylation domain-containing protein
VFPRTFRIGRRASAFTLVELPVVSKRGRAAFTLVELLVVIGIIAVLIAILLPVLGKARAQSRKTVCLSNLRTLGQMTHLYAAENKGWLPTRSNGAPWPPQVLHWTGAQDQRPLFERYLTGYTVERSSPVLYCPGNDGLFHSYDQAWNKSLPGMYLIGYAYYGGYPHSQFWAAAKRPRKITDKSSIPIFGDMAEDKTLSHPGIGWMYVSHAKRANSAGIQFARMAPDGMHCVTLDGSARWYAYSEDPAKSEMEPCIKVPGGSVPGFYWGKPAR